LPTPLFNYLSLYECLFQEKWDYTLLKIFGCLCYPWLRPYTKSKLERRSSPCIFLVYIKQHKD
ncbi:hypothetical protein, partial [Vibrio vulnificus]|uniref:hypothetical protein n=1 Tax=Vibrio vulnificus TaxID=672 RepID=UPI0040330975